MAKFLNFVAKQLATKTASEFAKLSDKVKAMDFETEMKNIQNSLKESCSRLSSHIHTYFDKWVVNIEYDMDINIISTQVQNGNFIIKVVNEGTNFERTLSSTIPEDVDVSSMKQTYDADKKMAYFTFKKKVV